jgi:hypothetical protein
MKTNPLKLTCKLVLLAALALASSLSTASAQMVMELSGSPGSPIVSYSLSGSATNVTYDGTYTGFIFDNTTGPYHFPAAISSTGYGVFDFTGTVTLTDETEDRSIGVDALVLQSKYLFGAERFGVDTTDLVDMNAGEIFTWSGSGTIDLSSTGLTFSDLTGGSVGGLQNDMPGFLIVDASAVPEPSTLALAGLGGLGLLLFRRNKTNRE